MRLLTLERSQRAAIITLNRPERRNALSRDLMHAFLETLDIIGSDADVRTVIIAAGGPVFSSGHDLSEMIGRQESEYSDLFEICTRLMLRLSEIPQPVIAEVQGLATAAGCQLVASCDLAVAAEEARFAVPGVRVGLFCTTPMVPVVRAIGRKRAMQMLLTGDSIDARTAEAWGLVNQVVPASELRNATLALATKIAASSAHTVSIGKRAFYEQIGLADRYAYDRATATMTGNALSADAQEGMAAFLEKRQPVWRGR
jgi:enoyl-CoA hydratase/carnithine racemase